MKRLLALAIVAAMVAVPVASANYLQTGYDSGRSGDIPFEGPQTNATAFEVQLPGTPVGQPVIDGDRALLVTMDQGFEGLDRQAVWSIDPATGNATELMAVPDDTYPLFPNSLAYDGHLLVWDSNTYEIVALEIPSGEEAWRVRALDIPTETHPGNGYDGSVRVGDMLYAGYWMNIRAGEVSGVVAVDLTEGERVWTWNRQEETREDDEVQGQESPAPLPDATGGPDRLPGSIQLSADPARVYAYLWHSSPRQQGELWAIDAVTGEAQWDHHDEMQTDVGYGTEGWAAASPLRVYIRLDAFQAFNPETGEELWTSPAGQTDQIEMQGATPIGATEEAVVATSPQSVYRMTPETGDVAWQNTITDFRGSYGTGETVVIDDDTAYVPVSTQDGEISGQGIEARDLETGELLWRWTDTPAVGHEDRNFSPGKLAYGPGTAIVGAKDGTVHVIGETEASLGEPEVEEQAYPEEGEQVTIDASGAEPGVHGEATRYMVDWGDGAVTGWQKDPEFSHTYNETGTYEAQVYAGNDANQTSSAITTMNVGQEEPNWVSERFEPENQDMTFGVLGVALAVGGGAIGVGQRYRKRSRLEQELEALEEGFQETKDQPSECEAFLDNRKARARSLAVDGYLREDQVPVVENRAEELRGELRTSALEEEFAFLPYGLVTKARQMVQDGDVTSLEREAFLRALEENEILTDEQKVLVRERIEAWYGRDAGGGGR